MFIPFVYEMATVNDASYLWFFYKSLDYCKKNHWPMIARETYTNKRVSDFAREGQRPAFDKRFVDEHFGYNLPHNEDLKKQDIYLLEDALTAPLIEQYGTISDAFRHLLSRRYAPLEERLRQYFDKMEQEYKQPVEGVFSLCYIESLWAVCRERGIPAVHLEMGTLREPMYLKTALFDTGFLFGETDVGRRWERFEQELSGKRELFTRRELLALLLREEHLGALERFDEPPVKKVGVALGYASYEVFSCHQNWTDLELLYQAEHTYGKENLLIRCHPGDPYGATYPRFSAQIDKSPNAFEFVLKCEKIAAICSNVAMEAMLWGRKANVMTPCTSWFAAGHGMKDDREAPGDDFMNFFVLGYLVPFELMMEPEYLRFRAGNPSEKEIYYRHVDFYFRKQGLPTQWIMEPGAERISNIMCGKKEKMK